MDQEWTWTGAWQFRRLISQLVSAWSGLKKIANNQVHTKFISNLSLWSRSGQHAISSIFWKLICASDYQLHWARKGVMNSLDKNLLRPFTVSTASQKSGRCSSWAELGKCVSMVWTAFGKNSSCQNVNWQVWVQSPKFQLSQESRDSNPDIQSSSGMSWSEPNTYHAICR